MDKRIVKFILFILFLSFVVSYIIESSGYYEYNLQRRAVLTSEAMKKFEKDTLDGKDVSLESYVIPSSKDYTNKLTNSTNKASTYVNKILKKGIENIFKMLGNFVKDE